MVLRLVFLVLVFQSSFTSDVNPLTDWKIAKKTSGVQISYRWVMIGDSLKGREIKVESLFFNSEDEILNCFRNSERFKSWSVSTKSCTIYEKSDSAWVTHSILDIPFPFGKQDVITKYSLVKHPNELRIQFKPIPNYKPLANGVERQKDFMGYWNLRSVSHNQIQLSFHSIALAEPKYPRFIQDPIIQHMLIGSFVDLKQILKKS
jgi:hypothetical protein